MQHDLTFVFLSSFFLFIKTFFVLGGFVCLFVKSSSHSLQDRTEGTEITSHIINIPHRNGTFVATDKPIAMHHNHPKYIVDIMTHS